MTGPILGGVGYASFDSARYAMSWDGNSISDGGISDLVAQTATLAPINNKISISNRAINGQNTLQMIADAGDIDSSYANGKTNFLLVWELTNNIHNIGRTGAQTIQDTIDYISARQAYLAASRPGQKPWRVILMTGIPRGDYYGSYFTGPQAEIEMQYCNAYIRANFKAMGAVAYVEARRAGGPFDFTDVTNGANFPQPFWQDRTHPGNGVGNGKSVLAGYIADVLKKLKA